MTVYTLIALKHSDSHVLLIVNVPHVKQFRAWPRTTPVVAMDLCIYIFDCSICITLIVAFTTHITVCLLRFTPQTICSLNKHPSCPLSEAKLSFSISTVHVLAMYDSPTFSPDLTATSLSVHCRHSRPTWFVFYISPPFVFTEAVRRQSETKSEGRQGGGVWVYYDPWLRSEQRRVGRCCVQGDLAQGRQIQPRHDSWTWLKRPWILGSVASVLPEFINSIAVSRAHEWRYRATLVEWICRINWCTG